MQRIDSASTSGTSTVACHKCGRATRQGRTFAFRPAHAAESEADHQVRALRAASWTDAETLSLRRRRGRHHTHPVEPRGHPSFRSMEQRTVLENPPDLLRPLSRRNLRSADCCPSLASQAARPVRLSASRVSVIRTCEVRLQPYPGLPHSPQGSKSATWCCLPAAGAPGRLPGRTASVSPLPLSSTRPPPSRRL